MFQSVRQNSQVFILHKTNNPYLEVGYVSNVSIPRNKYIIPLLFGLLQEMVIDLVVKVNGQSINLSGVPTHLEITDTIYNGDTIVISDNRDAMNAAIRAYKLNSVDTISQSGIERHLLIITGCDKILNELNPEYAQNKQLQEEVDTLKSQMEEMRKNMSELMEANRLLIEQFNRKETNNELSMGNS